MFLSSLFLSRGMLLFLLFQAFCLEAQVCHIEELSDIPSLVSTYRLIDLGETDFYPPEALAKNPKSISFAPAINNYGTIIANLSSGGVLRECGQEKWEFAPKINGIKVFFHALNDNGDLVVTLIRDNHALEWMLWPCNVEGYSSRVNIQTVDPFYSKFRITALNDSRLAVGYEQGEEKLPLPVIYTPDYGLIQLGTEYGLDAYGKAKAVNQAGAVAGNYDTTTENTIFLWKANRLDVLKNYRQLLDPTGWYEFADMVLTEDEVVYGTYWLRYCSNNDLIRNSSYHYAYVWNPRCNEFTKLDLGGMRISAVNKDHDLVGTINGSAVLRKSGRNRVSKFRS